MNILITGASQGIGYEVSVMFAELPEGTIIAIARNEKKLKQLQDECLTRNPDSRLIPVVFVM
jgi:short-subunit dehydrogenase